MKQVRDKIEKECFKGLWTGFFRKAHGKTDGEFMFEMKSVLWDSIVRFIGFTKYETSK